MKYRDQVISKLDVLENTLRTLERIVQNQLPIEEYLNNLNKANKVLEETKNLISIEPMVDAEVSI